MNLGMLVVVEKHQIYLLEVVVVQPMTKILTTLRFFGMFLFSQLFIIIIIEIYLLIFSQHCKHNNM